MTGRIDTIAIVIYLLGIIVGRCLARAQNQAPQSTDPDQRIYSLLGHESMIELRAFQWIGEDQLIMQFSFQTRSYHGQLLRFIATREDRQPVLEIKVRIAKRTILISAEDFVDQNDKKSTVHFTDIDVSDGEFHRLSITVDPKGDLLVELNGISRAGKVGLQKAQSSLDSTIYIGGTPGEHLNVPSIIGCIGKFSIGYGPVKVQMVEEKRDGEIDDGCTNACRDSDCAKENPTACVNNYKETICDCVGTHKEGAFCSEEPKVYHFDGGQYIGYEFGTHEHERRPRRLHVSFKSESNEEPALLLYAGLASEGEQALAVIVNKDSIEIRLRSVSILKTPTKHELNNLRWHDVTLEFNYPKSELTLKLDSETYTSSEWSTTDSEVSFNEIYFGGYKNEELAKSFRGCLRSAYIDYQSISSLIASDDIKLKYGKTPLDGSCPLADFDTVVEPATSEPEPKTEAETTTLDVILSTAPHQEHVPPSEVLRDEHTQPPTTTQPTITCADLRCQHGTRCVEHNAGHAHCDCRASGYTGRLCQFSKLPKTCHELYQSGEHRDGVFRIDPDGSGPLEPVMVKCEQGAITYVDHNFVNGTYVRQAQKKDTTYAIVYRNMSAQALKSLSQNSEICEQYIRMECSESPLFLTNSTWFHSAQRQEAFSAIGGSSDDKKCPCGRQRSCGTSQCACDVGDKQPRSDEGYYTSDLAGITEMTFLQHPASSGWTKVALSPLTCRGSKGTEDLVQFRQPSSVLSFGAWKGQYLSFWFKTSVKNGRLFSQGSSTGRYFNADIEQGHTLAFYLSLRKDMADVAVVTRLVSQSPINDAVWHRVKVEVLFNQIRFSIDDKVDAFYNLSPEDSLDATSFDKNFIFGGSDDPTIEGYVGCARQLIINEAPVRLQSDNLPEGIVRGCQKHCTGEGRCFNNAECIEDYQNDRFVCKCVNEYTYIGDYCQIDINQGTEVSFQNAANSYILVRDFAIDPIANNRLVFSFRTDQTSALLLFAHDDNYNMVQLHLLDGNRISLTVNYERELRQCTIVKKGADFNNMQWYQVVVTYEADHTSLFVDKDMCQIDGGRRLSQEYLEEWEGDIPKLRVVYPPRPPVPPSQMPSYSLLFVGGVYRQPRLRIPRQSRQIVYTSPLPNLLGCLRGFRIGNQQLDLRSANKSNVKDGCDVGCGRDDLRCEHGGYCVVDWARDQRASCDCAPTSYFGNNCAQDHGLHFDGVTYVKVQLELILQRLRLPEERSYDSLSFAFSTSAAHAEEPQILAYVMVNSEKDIRVYLDTEGRLNMEIHEPDRHTPSNDHNSTGHKPYSHTFNGKFNDGQRHFVFLKFFGDKLVAKVDNQYQEVHKVKWRLSDVRTISLGGAELGEEDGYDIYTGCMTNALIDFRSPVPHAFKPFDDLLNPSGTWHESYQRFFPDGGRLDAAQCAQYTVEHPMPTEGPVTALPPFTEPMQTYLYAPTGTPPSNQGGKGGGLGIAIGLAVLVIVVLVCLAIYLYYAKCVKPKRNRQHQPPGDVILLPPAPGNPEKELFLPSPDDPHPGHLHGPRHAPELTELPEANEDLDGRSNRGSVNAGRPPTSSSPPPPYAPTATPPLSPSNAAVEYRDTSRPASMNGPEKTPTLARCSEMFEDD